MVDRKTVNLFTVAFTAGLVLGALFAISVVSSLPGIFDYSYTMVLLWRAVRDGTPTQHDVVRLAGAVTGTIVAMLILGLYTSWLAGSVRKAGQRQPDRVNENMEGHNG